MEPPDLAGDGRRPVAVFERLGNVGVVRHLYAGRGQSAGMRIEYDRDTCIGMFQCVAEWDAFERDEDAGKAVLAEGEEREEGVFVREVPDDAELDAKFATRACPVDAITLYDDGEQLIP